MIFKDIKTCVLNAGRTSAYFFPSNGVKQGCCVSPLLFVITVELMSRMLKSNRLIEGITIGSSEFVTSQFADDTTCFLRNVSSVEAAMDTLDLFRKFSGLQISLRLSPSARSGIPQTSCVAYRLCNG